LGVTDLVLKVLDESPLERHLHPSIYEKIRKTNDLIQKGIDQSEFRFRGGLDLETYNALQQRWHHQEKDIEEREQEIISKHGSLKNAPSSMGYCKKIDPVVGSKNALVFLTEFKDKKHTYEPDYFQDLLFGKGRNRSMREYFLEASWNQLDINGDVENKWYNVKNNRSEYLDTELVKGHLPNARKLAEETLLQAKKSSKLDFSKHAQDGKIEIPIIIYAGKGQDTKLDIGFIRPHQDKLREPIEIQEGIMIDKYCIVPELPIDDIGCCCHEVGHFLGLPDLYKEGYAPVVGGWCLMGVGCYIDNGKTPAHPSAWCKVYLGWAEPKLLSGGPEFYEIPAIIDSKDIYKIEVQGTDGKEYFLLENRQQKGFERNLPGSGLLIWHVNENVCALKPPNADPKHYFISVKESDGKLDLQMNKIEVESKKELLGDPGDPFPGITDNRTFDDNSNPNSRSYNGNKSFVKVKSISDSKDKMNAEIGVEPHSREAPSKNVYEYQMPPIVINPLFINLMASPPKAKDPYDKLYDEIMDILLEDFKENASLKLYQHGYRRGYDEAKKRSKKSKK
jgi:immune inhibitor A